MISYSTGEIARVAGCTLSGNPACTIRQICTDSRRIDLPNDSLFVALRGPSHDGHRFLPEAYKSGIRSFLVETVSEPSAAYIDCTFLVAANSLDALQKLAAWHRQNFTGKLIAITGSNGKTIIKEWLAQIMQSEYLLTKSPKSYNSQLGVPLSVLNISGSEDYAIMEAGISMPGEMAALQKILDPWYGLISNIGDAHQESFPDLHRKASEKISLFTNCKHMFYCADHEIINEEITLARLKGQLHTWSRYKPANLYIHTESTDKSSCRLSGTFQSRPVTLTLPFTDPASIENCIHIWLLLLTIGFDEKLLQQQVYLLEPIRMRLEQKAGINGCTLINDYYNSDILSLKIALDLLYQQTPQARKTLILSDILQTGQSEESLYSGISNLLGQRTLFRLVGIGPAITRNRSLFSQTIEVWPSTAAFISELRTDEYQEEAILLKGARSFAFENISNLLEARIHATKLEIRMNDVRFNLEQYRKTIGPDVRIMAMVKAFSYGSGGIEMAKFLANERIDYLGVAFADEGIEIRRAGIHIPVMVMNPDFQQSDLIIEHHLEPEIYSWSGLNSFTRTLRNLSLNPYPIHIKIDTGMHRLGFDFGETEQLTEYLLLHPEVYLKSVFSHLAASEDPEQDAFTRLQISRFNEACRILAENIRYPFLRHLANSSAIERFPEAHFEMVRLGIGLYGLGNTGILNLKPIATLKTIISQIHLLAEGESVGYGRKAILKQAARIGIIPVGYADGIDRRLGNGNLKVLIKGKHMPTIGNICMDMTLIDLTNSEAVEGDEVIIFGPDNPVTCISDSLSTIPYEVLTSISPRVKRIYQFD